MKSKERKKVVADRATSGVGIPVPIVGIGASAGGLEAFVNLLRHMPLDTGLGFVLVQHLDPEHDSALPQILTRATSMPVREVTNNLRVEANHVYVIPPNTLLSIAQGVLTLQPRQQTRRPLRSIDSFFESLAQDQRERAIGVILSGTASDGTLGLEAIKAEGGITFAQDESAKYDSMPRSAVAAGCVDFILSPEHIAKELARIAKHPYVAGQPVDLSSLEEDQADAMAHQDDDTPLPSGGRETARRGGMQRSAEAEYRPEERAGGRRTAENGYKKILLLLRNHAGVDFSLYKQTTIQRRITRRMVLNKHNTLDDYAHFLRGTPKELDALYSDALISVTSFFRNPDAFDVLTRTVFPKLLQQRGDAPIRVWVLGCSTGQEAYSIAMAFMETAENAPRMRKLQVFATDLNDALLDKARHGLYAKSLALDLSPERLRRFFVEEDGGYRISKALRDMVVFARQNLVADPPFSRMDLISCRNLLIYLEPSVQKQVMPTFHYALKPGGFLLLGASESIGGFTDLFDPVDKKHKLYAKKPAPTPAFHLPVKKERDERPLSVRRRQIEMPLPIVKGPAMVSEAYQGELNAQREADRVTVNQFAPPGVLITADLQILQFRGPTGAYLAPPRGKASFDVLKMAREGLMLPLRDAINRAKRRNTIAHKHHVRVQQNGKTRTVNIKVIPLKHVRERCFLILFEDAGLNPPRSGSLTQRHVRPRQSAKQHINELETDLAETRDYLQTIQEQHQAANEELQASNEEVQSANEELQSVNEELETSKEELESANEELTTVNEEMANRNVELARLNGDLLNLQTSIKLAILLLGRDLTIRRFTPQAESLFNLLATDVGRPLGNVRHNLVFGERRSQASPPLEPRRQEREPVRAGWEVERLEGLPSDASDLPSDLETMAAEVIASVREREHEVRDTKGRWYLLRARPYFTQDNKVDGALLVLVDIDELKRSGQAVAQARDSAKNTIETMPIPLLVLDKELHVEIANLSFYRTFRVSPAETVGRFIYDLGNRQWDILRLRELLEQILLQNTIVEKFEVEHNFEQLGRRTMLLNAVRNLDPARKSERILLTIQDITERKQAEHALRVSEEQFRALFNQTTGGIAQTDVTGRFTLVNDRYCDIVGRSREELLTLRMHDITHPDDLSANAEQFRALVQGGPSFVVEKRYLRPDGSTVWVHNDVAGLRDNHGRVSHVVAAVADITDRKRAAAGSAMLASIVQSSDDAVMSTGLDGVITSWNAAAERMFGYSAAEAVGRSVTMLIPPDLLDEEPKIIDRLTRGERVDHFETKRLRKDGSLLDISLTISPVKDADGRTMGASAIARDLTERKHLLEKEVLLKEIHHRIKNNMQIVSTLLDLQSEHAQDRQALEMFKESRNRVKSMALIHERLYQSQDLARVNFAEYVQQLADDLYHAYKVSSDEIVLSVDVNVPALSIDVAVPCGLLLNELISNCLKHAFKDVEQGRIRVSLYRGDDDTTILTVADDGVGFPHDLDFRHTTSFGLQLVNTLVEQLHGEIILTSNRLTGNRGTAFTVTFPNKL